MPQVFDTPGANISLALYANAVSFDQLLALGTA